MAMKKEQMLIVVILTMSTFLLVSDGLVLRTVLEKFIFMRKMVTNLAGHCPMFLNPFEILDVLNPPAAPLLQNQVQKSGKIQMSQQQQQLQPLAVVISRILTMFQLVVCQ